MKAQERPFSKMMETASFLGGKCLIVNESGEVLGAFLTSDALEELRKGESNDFLLKKDKKSHIFDHNDTVLTEKEILDKINRELQEWEQSQSIEKTKEIEAALQTEEGDGEAEDRYYLEPVD